MIERMKKFLNHITYKGLINQQDYIKQTITNIKLFTIAVIIFSISFITLLIIGKEQLTFLLFFIYQSVITNAVTNATILINPPYTTHSFLLFLTSFFIPLIFIIILIFLSLSQLSIMIRRARDIGDNLLILFLPFALYLIGQSWFSSYAIKVLQIFSINISLNTYIAIYIFINFIALVSLFLLLYRLFFKESKI